MQNQSGVSKAPLGEAKLSTVHVIGQALAIGPIFSAGAVSATVAAVAGYNTPLSVLLAFVGAMCLAYVIVLYARRFAGAGAIYEYLAKGVHNSFGVFAAGIYILGMMFLGAGGIYIVIGYLTEGFFLTHLDTDIAWWLGGGAALAFVFVLTYLGVRVSVLGVLALAVISAVPFVVLCLVIIAKGGADGNSLAVFDPGRTSWDSVFNGLLFGVLLFIGFEAAASVAEETREPRRSIPIAVVAVVVLTGLFYLLTSYAGAIGFGEGALGEENAWVAAPSAYGQLATEYVGNWLGVIVDLVIILDAVSLAIAIMVTASRILFVLGRDSLLPKAVAAQSSRGTPLGGGLVIAVWAVLMLIWGGVASYGSEIGLSDPFAAFLIVNATGSYLVQLVYIFLALAALGIVWRARAEGGLLWKIPVILGGLAFPLLAYKGSLDPFPEYPLNRGVYFALAMIAITFLWWLYLRLTRNHLIEAAAVNALEPQHPRIRPSVDAPAAEEPAPAG